MKNCFSLYFAEEFSEILSIKYFAQRHTDGEYLNPESFNSIYMLLTVITDLGTQKHVIVHLTIYY